MNIKEFIKGTINDITNAVIELNEERSKDGIILCPSDLERPGSSNPVTQDGRCVRVIEFNLSVTVTDKTDTNTGLGINIAKAVVGNESSNTSANTIKFSIPVAFPLLE